MNQFTVQIAGTVDHAIAEAKATAQANNMQFDGDDVSGNFSGDGVSGTYAINGQTCTVVITSKPFYIPLSAIQSEVAKLFS